MFLLGIDREERAVNLPLAQHAHRRVVEGPRCPVRHVVGGHCAHGLGAHCVQRIELVSANALPIRFVEVVRRGVCTTPATLAQGPGEGAAVEPGQGRYFSQLSQRCFVRCRYAAVPPGAGVGWVGCMSNFFKACRFACFRFIRFIGHHDTDGTDGTSMMRAGVGGLAF